jgi:hypothetical protein
MVCSIQLTTEDDAGSACVIVPRKADHRKSGLSERHTLGTSSLKAAAGHCRASPRKSCVMGNFRTS